MGLVNDKLEEGLPVSKLDVPTISGLQLRMDTNQRETPSYLCVNVYVNTCTSVCVDTCIVST